MRQIAVDAKIRSSKNASTVPFKSKSMFSKVLLVSIKCFLLLGSAINELISGEAKTHPRMMAILLLFLFTDSKKPFMSPELNEYL